MPRYDFQCEAGHRFELELPFGSSMEQPCARCEKTARRGFHTPMFRYRGMGFYTTDTRKNRRKPEKDPESSGRSGEPPPGGLPQEGKTKHGDEQASTGGVVRGSRPSRSDSAGTRRRSSSRGSGSNGRSSGGSERRSRSKS